MAELKTTINDQDVTQFIKGIENEKRKEDSIELLKIMKGITNVEPKMWGNTIVGFDSYHFKYESGREGDWFITGFSPRKQNMSIYIMSGFGRYDELMSKLGKYKTGKSCLYVNKLEDVDMEVLKDLIDSSYQNMVNKYHK